MKNQRKSKNSSSQKPATRNTRSVSQKRKPEQTDSEEESMVIDTKTQTRSNNQRSSSVKSKQKPTRNNRSSSAKQTKSELNATQAQRVYNKGIYVAFIDACDYNQYFIGKLLDNLNEDDETVLVDIFRIVPDQPYTFLKFAARQPVAEYAIMCELNAKEVAVKKGAKAQIKIDKKQDDKVKKLMPATAEIVKQEMQGEEDEDEYDDEDDEEDEEEEEEIEIEEESEILLTVEDKNAIKNRRLVYRNGKLPAASQPLVMNKGAKKPAASKAASTKTPAKKEQTKAPAKRNVTDTSKAAKNQGKSSRSPSKTRAKAKKGKDEEMQDDEEEKKGSEDDQADDEQEDESEEIINTSTKQQVQARKGRKSDIFPKVGVKRLRASKKKNLDEEDDEEREMVSEDEEGSSGADAKASKKRKLANGKVKVVKEKKKKAPKRPTVFKKGRWNPDIELVDKDYDKEDTSNNLHLECCTRCNNRNIIRAAITQNEKLLKNGMAATNKISNLIAYWGPECKWTSLEIIVKQNLHNFLEIMLHPRIDRIPQHSTYQSERDQQYNKRVHDAGYLMSFIDSGMVSHMAYGARVRKVQQTRGNRQGNNAFMEYQDNQQRNPVYLVQDEWFLKTLMYNPSVEYETFQQLYKLNPNIESFLQNFAYEAVRAGNRKIAYELIKNMAKHTNFGFNQLHVDVLSENAQIDKVLKVSVGKKAGTNKDITPLFCACINPNPKFVRALLEVGPDNGMVDSDLRRACHYAAACENSEPLQAIMTAGFSILDVDNQKMNCLHVAAMTGRADNARIILTAAPQLLSAKDKKSMTAMAYACKFGHTGVVKVLLEFKAKVNQGCGINRMAPISWASAYGHQELVEFLLDNKGRTLSKDKFARTPLIMAVRNGHTKIASLLLQRGAEWNHNDSSKNTPLHYATAYGWIDCINLLIKAGADVNAQNSWKISPINIGMLKNHNGCVKRLLEEPNVNVNGKDDKGRTLIMLSLLVLDDETEEFVSYLLKKGADPNIADLEGQTTLHYIAKYVPKGIDPQTNKANRVMYFKQVEIQKKVTQLLIQYGADLTIKDSQKRTPFTICLDSDNAPLLDFLKEKVSINKEPDLFFAFKDKIFNVQYQKILERLVLNDPPTKETINYLDEEGFTPFLRFIKSFTEQYNNFFTNIQNRVNQLSFIYQNDTSKYQIKNEDLFDKFADQSNYYAYNYNFSQDQKNIISKKFLDEIIVQPFIQILKFLISQGADENITVQKLKKYRDIELQKNNLFAQLNEGQQVKLKEEEEKIQSRAERLGKMKVGRNRGGLMTNPFGMTTANFGMLGAPQQLNENDGTDKYETIGGQKVLREYGIHGKRNAIHILMAKPQERLFEFILSLKVDPDLPDYDEITPFNQLSKDQTISSGEPMFQTAFDKLLDLEVRVDYPDIKGRTPFLNFYDQQHFEIAYKLLQMGANVNQMDISGLFALKYALIRRQNEKIQELLDFGANINQIDNKGRNLLHHAINMSSATADATFETEQFLIEKGVHINTRDNHNRTPLHYAFVKIDNWNDSTQIDPIETVSSMCGIKGLEIDVTDKWQRTPLHYASQRGASICALYLIQRGADMESKDIYGNTPLGLSLIRKHYNYGVLLIQKNASVLPLTYREDYERINKMWAEEEKKKKLLESKNKNGLQDDQEMEDVTITKKKKKNHRNLFNPNKSLIDDYGDEYDNEYDDEDDDEDDDNMGYQYQENVFNQQNAFRQKVYAKKARPARYNGFGGGLFGNNGFGMNGYGQPAQQVAGDLITDKDLEGVSMFKLAIRGGQQGLAYLMLDNQYDLMHAMQDAMDEKKFMLVLTLLSKNPDDSIIQQKNKKGQNLFHILSMNASSCSQEHLKRIYDALMKRGVDVRAKDNFGRNALHYAVIGNSETLVSMLLSEQPPYDPNEVDNEGFTPLAHCIKGKALNGQLYNPDFPNLMNIFTRLMKAGADVNVVYPEEIYKPAFKHGEIEDNHYDPKGKYLCTPLINLIRLNPTNVTLRCNLIGLIEHGAKLDILDSDGRDPIMHAVMKNNTMVVTILLENKRALKMNPEGQDLAGKSAVHYVINPLPYGSYENVEILRLLHTSRFNMKLQDNEGKTPAAYASEQESGVMLKELAKLSGLENQLNGFRRQLSAIDTGNWPEQKVDFEMDSEQYMEEAHEKEKKLAKEKEFKVPVDKTGKFEKSYEVYYDDNDHPWDVYLTKVDLKNGIYGDYVFYKMQLLHDKNRDLYVVFTRWGRIGEPGMNQRTPFNDIDEAKDDFKKIFKAKTGGNNFEELDSFSRVKKKYNITRVNYIHVNYKDYLQPFDYEKCPKSKLSQPIFDLFEEISNVTMYQRAMNQYGLDTEVMPFSAVKKESLIEARQVLMEIQELLKEDQELSKLGINADYDKLSALKEQVGDLSSRYYELIPQSKYKDSIAPPLNSMHVIKAQYDMLDGLTNIEYAAKMLLAALYRQQEMNPVDYVYQALNLLIEPLDKELGEYEVIKQYIDQTRGQDAYGMHQERYEISNIFKMQRKGEAESISAYKDVPNHFLLFHGSAMFNFIGILSQGLRIAPPEAPTTGYMFGKGVYFADMFEKSFAYAMRGYNQQDSYLMLMCEVVLGKSKEIYNAEYIERLEHPYSSVKGCGRRGPGYKHTVTCPNGVKIPLGQVINYHEGKPQMQNQLMLQHNEYIVYNTSQIRMRYMVQMSKKKPEKSK